MMTFLDDLKDNGLGWTCWNPGHVRLEILKRAPTAVSAEYHVTTGLWADVTVWTPTGFRKLRALGRTP